jgi:hypothetical protein
MTDAISSSQIGQPAAWIMASKTGSSYGSDCSEQAKDQFGRMQNVPAHDAGGKRNAAKGTRESSAHLLWITLCTTSEQGAKVFDS